MLSPAFLFSIALASISLVPSAFGQFGQITPRRVWEKIKDDIKNPRPQARVLGANLKCLAYVAPKWEQNEYDLPQLDGVQKGLAMKGYRITEDPERAHIRILSYSTSGPVGNYTVIHTHLEIWDSKSGSSHNVLSQRIGAWTYMITPKGALMSAVVDHVPECL